MSDPVGPFTPAALPELLRDVAAYLRASGATDYKHACLAMSATWLLSNQGTSEDLFYLAANLATLAKRSLSCAAYGARHDDTPFRVTHLQSAARFLALTQRAMTLALAAADAEHPGWREVADPYGTVLDLAMPVRVDPVSP